MIAALGAALVLAVVAGAWALLEAAEDGADAGCGPGCGCRRTHGGVTSDRCNGEAPGIVAGQRIDRAPRP